MDARNDALEIVAQFDGSILDVQHLTQRSNELRTREKRARALVAGGGAALTAALALFALSCTRITLPRALDFVAAALLTAGVWLLLRGLGRLAERPRHAYSVGDDAGADLPL